MASNIFYSQAFQRVIDCDVESSHFENDTQLIELTGKVITYLRTTELQKGEEERLTKFVEKIQQIEKKIDQTNQASDLRIYVSTLEVFKRLRAGMESAHQDIIQDEFIFFLEIIKERELDDPLNRMVQLVDFLEGRLLPSLENASSLKELSALEPLVDDCILLIDRLRKEKAILGGATESLGSCRETLVNLLNAKRLQLTSFYQDLLGYERGGLGNFLSLKGKKEQIQKLVSLFKENMNHPAFSRREKIAFFRAIAIIEAEFFGHGMQVTFSMEEEFCSFLKNELLARVKEAKSLAALNALKSDLEKCEEVAKLFKRATIDKVIDELMKAQRTKRASFSPEKRPPAEKPLSIEKKPAVALQTSQQDRKTIEKLSKEIVNLRPTIGDADAYWFSASHGKYIDEAKSQSAARGMLAASMRLYHEKKRYSDAPEEILRLGRSLLSNKTGVCDHMAAAVVAKIVEHIQKGGQWNADVELIGNGAHAFIVINRPHGNPNDLDNWKGAIIVDTWLEAVGVNPKYKSEIPSPENGIISNPEQVQTFAAIFGAPMGRMSVTRRFSAEELRALAKK